MPTIFALCFLGLLSAAPGPQRMTSGDASVRFDAQTTSWTLSTAVIEQQLRLSGGMFQLAALKNRLTGTEYAADAGSDEFRFTLAGIERSGRTGSLTLRDYLMHPLPVPKASPGIEPGALLSG